MTMKRTCSKSSPSVRLPACPSPLAMFDSQMYSCSYHLASGVTPHQMSDGLDVSQTSCHGRGDDDLPGQYLLVRLLPCQRISEHHLWPDFSEEEPTLCSS